MLLRLLVVLCVLGQMGVSPVLSLAQASENDRGIPRISFKSEEIPAEGHPDKKVEIAVETILPRDARDNRAALQWASEQLSSHPNAERKVVLATNEAEDVATMSELKEQSEELMERVSRTARDTDKEVTIVESKVPDSVVEGMRSRTQGIKDAFFRHERVTLSVMRTSVNGTVVALGLVFNAGLPLITALPIAIVTGAMSGTVQYFNPQFQRLIDGDPEKNQRIIESGRFGRLRVKTTQLFKWFVTEVALYGIINGVKAAAGAPMEGFMAESLKVLKSSLMATASQGVWDATLAENTRREIGQNEGNAEAQRRVQFRSNVVAFGVSMASVFGGVLSLVGSSMGTWSLAALGVTGAIYAVRSWRRNSSTPEHGRMSFGGNCRTVFN